MSQTKGRFTDPMTKVIRCAMLPKDAHSRLKDGNKRYTGKKRPSRPRRRGVGRARNRFIRSAYADGQNPFAIVLSCVDSRIPTEVIFDQEIGDIFNARIAGNFVNEDILGSMEFAAGYVKLIVVLGHTSCGAVDAACGAIYQKPPSDTNNNCDDENKEKESSGIPPNLAQLVGKLTPSVIATPFDGNKLESPTKKEWNKFVNQAAITNVQMTMNDILTRSDFLREKIFKKEIGLVGAMYDVKTGRVDFKPFKKSA